MKKKRRWVPVAIVAVIVLLCAVGFGMYCLRFCVGIYVETKSGENMVVIGNNPIVMSDKTNPDRFDGLETGDRVFVVCGFVEETYPARSEAKVVVAIFD